MLSAKKNCKKTHKKFKFWLGEWLINFAGIMVEEYKMVVHSPICYALSPLFEL